MRKSSTSMGLKTSPLTIDDDCAQDAYPSSLTPPGEKDDFYDRFCSESFHAVVISEDGFKTLEEKGLIS